MKHKRYTVSNSGAISTKRYHVVDNKFDPPIYVDWYEGCLTRHFADEKAKRLNERERKTTT